MVLGSQLDLYEVVLGVRCGGEVQVSAFLFEVGEPVAHGRGPLRGEVIQHDVDVEMCGGVQVDSFEEDQHVAAGVPSAGLVQHL